MLSIRLIVVLTILLLLRTMLSAQASPYQEAIESKRIALAYDPINDRLRCELAYYQMLAHQTEQALGNYRFVLQRDGANPDAQAGTLWALNSLNKYKETIATAKRFIASGDSPILRYHLGNARLGSNEFFSAVPIYRQVLLDTNEPVIYGITQDNLARAYLAIGDVAKAEDVLSKTFINTLHQSDPSLQSAFTKLSFNTVSSVGLKSGDAMYWSVGGGIRYRTMYLDMGMDQFRIGGKRLRDTYKLNLAKQFIPADVGIRIQYLTGTDQRIYPGLAASAAISPKLYLGPSQAVGRLSGSISSFERHNVYQYDLGLQIRSDILSVSYLAAHLYQDNEALNADTRRWVHTLDLSANIWQRMNTSLYFGTGNLAWYTNSMGDIIDDFEPADQYLGVSCSVPLSQHITAILYYQLGFTDEDNSHLAYTKLHAWF